MKWSPLFVFACVIAQSMSALSAQTQARLLCEVTVNGSVVAKPELRVMSGQEGELWFALEPGARDSFKGWTVKARLTPVVQGDDIAISFNIATGDKSLRPSLVISKGVRGAFEWTSSSGVPIKLSIEWAQ